MLALLGHALLLAALAAAVSGVALALRGRSLGTRRAAQVTAAAVAGASAILVAGLLRSDFSMAYVAEVSNRDLAGIFRFSAWWGGQAGSLLLWLLLAAPRVKGHSCC